MTSQGFQIDAGRLEIEEERISGPVTKDSQTYFLKLCKANSSTTTQFQNEATFYDQLSKLSLPAFIHPVSAQTPQEIQEYYFFLREFFPQETALGTHHGVLKSDFSDTIPQVVTLLYFLQSQNLDLPAPAGDHIISPNQGTIKERILTSANRYAKDVRKIDPQPLLDLITETDFIEKQALATSEIVPWHLFTTQSGLAFIDTEWASPNYPIHYDAALSFCRIFSYYPKEPSAAINLLKQYTSNYQGQESREAFQQHLRGLIALRTIGQLRDISLSKEPAPHFDQLVKLTLSNKLFP